METRLRVYHLLEPEPNDAGIEKAINIIIMILIVANVAALVMETVQPLYVQYQGLFYALEAVSILVFSVEYVLRLWSAGSLPQYKGVRGLLRFATSPFMVVDFISIAPFYLPFVSADLLFLRGLRLLRFPRLLKLGRYSEATRTIVAALKSKREELITLVVFAMILLLVSSSLMYFVEHDAQPEAFPSIPAAMWWGAMTLTTVGYGDVFPITPLGKLLASVIAGIGIALFALPAGLLGSAFLEQVQRRRSAPRRCPSCGTELDDS
jgi:voltage-gated potassium channel